VLAFLVVRDKTPCLAITNYAFAQSTFMNLLASRMGQESRDGPNLADLLVDRPAKPNSMNSARGKSRAA
jgi:hypothetical protein